MTSKALVVVVLVVGLTGCNSSDFPLAELSGRVTLNGEPVEYASVTFTPVRTGESVIVGPPSVGETDADGRFDLQTIKNQAGAVVGPHRVSISTYEARMVDPTKSDKVEVIAEEIIPRRYRAGTELTFDVPPEGSEEANFDLIAR